MESIEQKIFSGSSPFPRKINVRHFSIADADDAVTYLLQDQPLSTSIIPVGVSCHSANKGGLDFITFSTTTTAVLITINKKKVQNPPNNFLALLSPGENIVDGTQSRCCLVGFSMDRSAIQISRATQHKVRGVDLGHVTVSAKKEHLRPLDIVVQEIKSLSVDKWRVSQLWMGTNKSSKSDTCLQSWLAACVGTRAIAKLKVAERVDSAFLKSSQELQCLSDLVTQSALLDRQQPKEILNEFSNAGLNKQGKFEVGNSRYKTRIRRGNESRVILTSSDGQHHIGHAQSSKGKKTIIDRKGGFSSVGPIRQIKIQGRQDPTNSEKAQDQFIYMLMTGETNLRRSAFIRDIWFPTSKKIPRITLSAANPSHINTTLSTMVLNDSQRNVVHAVCGDAPIVIVHGPPGTGKTTTISASSRIWAEHRFPAWIVAHSNVAVKNIAESLSKRSVSYKLIVSKEFYAEWHEHLYDGVEDNLIRSDDLPKDIVAMERLLGDSRIMLCTLSMVFCPALQANRTFEIVPMERLIIDEASQINVFEFMAVFEKFHKTLGKICFFGDPKQLPPYGKDDVPSIKTIFDIKHLSNAQKDFFLDTQYRMPVPIGHFLSARVYDGRLQSVHSIKANSCVAFINVPISRGPEKQVGKSYKNDGEVQTVVHLVKHYYKHQNFCIITPYDLQRATIQAALKAENLPADSVFAVDSFQGNEADFIIVSAVRTGKPGFLVSLNRMNVTLSRCKKGMVIVTSQDFLKAGGAKTLLGELAKHWEKAEGGSKVWREWQTVASGSADLPGVLGPHRPSRPRRIP